MDAYVARQAIFDTNKQVIAYELLFRSSNINEFTPTEGLNPTLDVIKNSFLVIGFDKVTEGKRAFINFDESLLKSGIIETLRKDCIVVEILETINPDDTIIGCFKNLKEKGYIIALDDFEYDNRFDRVMEYVDIIKVDFNLTRGKERRKIIDKIRNKNIKLLAEKVETIEDYVEALDYGYSYFQGYFFYKPVIIPGNDICVHKFTYVKLIKELSKEIVDIENVEDLIKSDVALSYKLLKITNSAHYSFNKKITSIRDAIMIVGTRELKRWVFVMELKFINKSSVEELVKTSLLRGYLGELIVKEIDFGIDSFDIFLTGLFSLMDALTKQPMYKILDELPVSEDIKEALAGKQNMLGELLNLIINYERGIWEEVNILVEKMGLDREFITNCYLRAIDNLKILNIV
ncbi:EAL and HDOD domain-containing protein [Clostridium kluyveri]|uniref:EAL and HDOD domain-containing protein n=1 Tax=Clostridium kluyveri TaxID=1534 RepID=UPI002245A04B|nr:HDOD domain-containing protein [Clostridium kluyveri]UZQ50769.1 HDOD domain-containing protein [Clostridium kluyveri]